MNGFWAWLVDTVLRMAALLALIDLWLIVERLVHRWERHRDECERCHQRAIRRAQKRRHERRALEATPHAGRELLTLRAWLKAPTGAASNPSPVGAPQSPVDAANPRPASTGLHLTGRRRD